mgnify:CR=1 FL=1
MQFATETMKIAIEITPDETITESDFQAIRDRAEAEGVSPDEWTAKAIRKALLSPNPTAKAIHQPETLAA